MNKYNFYTPAFEVTRITACGISEIDSIMELKCCESGETQYVAEFDDDWQDEEVRNHFWPNQIWKGEAFVTEEEFEWFRNQVESSLTIPIPNDVWEEMWFETAAKLGIPGDRGDRSI
jgi:hypothetical protein